MAFLEIICFLSSVIPLVHASSGCPVSRCGSNGSAIGFPFHIPGQQPQNCGYPGFGLTCRAPALTVLRLPYWGDFFVRGIDYITQEIRLYDPDDCLARRLLAFNLTASPFAAGYYRNYTFLACAPEPTSSRFTAISCLSNSTSSVLAISSMSLGSKMSSCRVLAANLTLPVPWPVEDDQDFSSDFNSDLLLTWDVPNCGDCRAQGGSCGFLSNSSLDIGCFYSGDGSNSSAGLQVFRILALSITLPAITCAVGIGIAVFMCCSDQSSEQRRVNAVQLGGAPLEVQEPAVVMGLDESTIESYTKVVLGESRRIPGINDSTCPICLSEYCTRETLRCIPECRHCFHAECIDEWLRLNGTCPVCRSSPSPVHIHSIPES